MKIKTHKGYGDTQHVEVVEPLTLDDFIIQEEAPYYSEYSKRVSLSLKLILKEEVVEAIKPILPQLHYVDKDVVTEWVKNYGRDIKFNGIRSEEAREKKIEVTRRDLAGEMALRKEDRTEKLLSVVREELEHKIEKMNHEYHEHMVRVFSGNNLNNDFIKEHLDDQDLVGESNAIDEEIKALEAKRDEVEEQLRIKRNENMLDYLNTNGWNDDEDGDKIYVTQEVRDEVTEMYQNHEAFQNKKRTRHPFML
jgi:tetrahydrodipicolinate N-succinyltransferase